jgi:hypothetical protein
MTVPYTEWLTKQVSLYLRLRKRYWNSIVHIPSMTGSMAEGTLMLGMGHHGQSSTGRMPQGPILLDLAVMSFVLTSMSLVLKSSYLAFLLPFFRGHISNRRIGVE